MSSGEKNVWLSLSNVFRIAYCQPFLESSYSECKKICEEFVQTTYEHFPEFKKKVKIHLILHLPEHMMDFGPTSAFNTERCETFNSLIRAQNIFGNRMAPSRDIARQFSIIEHLRFICSSGSFDGSTRCGEGLVSLFNSVPVQSFLNGIPLSNLRTNKPIYQPGALRKVSSNTATLSNLEVQVKGSGNMKVHQVTRDPKCTILLMSFTTDTLINPARAVIGSSKRELIHLGNSVQFSAVPDEVDIGVLAACFIVPGERSRPLSGYCIVQLYQPMDSSGTPLCNEYNCPLYVLTDTFRCVPSLSISDTLFLFFMSVVLHVSLRLLLLKVKWKLRL